MSRPISNVPYLFIFDPEERKEAIEKGVTEEDVPVTFYDKSERLVGFGKHGHLKLKDCPKDYCIWMFRNTRDNGTNNEVRNMGAKYIQEENKPKAKHKLDYDRYDI